MKSRHKAAKKAILTKASISFYKFLQQEEAIKPRAKSVKRLALFRRNIEPVVLQQAKD